MIHKHEVGNFFDPFEQPRHRLRLLFPLLVLGALVDATAEVEATGASLSFSSSCKCSGVDLSSIAFDDPDERGEDALLAGLSPPFFEGKRGVEEATAFFLPDFFAEDAGGFPRAPFSSGASFWARDLDLSSADPALILKGNFAFSI